MDTAILRERARLLNIDYQESSKLFGEENRKKAYLTIISESLKLRNEIKNASEYIDADAQVKAFDKIVDSLPHKECADILGESEYHTDNGGMKQRVNVNYNVPAIIDADPQGFMRNKDILFDDKGKFTPAELFEKAQKDDEFAKQEDHFIAVVRSCTLSASTAWLVTKK